MQEQISGTIDGEASGEQLVRGCSGRLLVSLSFGYLVIHLGQNAILLLPAITDDLGISPFLAEAALTTITGVYAITMYHDSRLSDGLTRKTVIVAALVVTESEPTRYWS